MPCFDAQKVKTISKDFLKISFQTIKESMKFLSKSILFDSGFDECSVCKQSMTMHYHIITFLSECQGVFQDFFLYFLNFPELSKSIPFDSNLYSIPTFDSIFFYKNSSFYLYIVNNTFISLNENRTIAQRVRFFGAYM